MAKAHLDDVVLSHETNNVIIVPYAEITVYEAGTNNPIIQTMYVDNAGTTIHPNPFNADEHGNFQFFIDNPQDVKLVITGVGVGTITRDYVAVDAPVSNRVNADGNGIIDRGAGLSYYAKNFNIISATRFIDPRKYGAKGDLEIYTSGSVTTGENNKINVGGASFDSSYVGKKIIYPNSKTSNSPGTYTISAIDSPTKVTIDTSGGNIITQSGLAPGNDAVFIGTDDSLAINLAIEDLRTTAKGGGRLYCPQQYLINDPINAGRMQGITIEGVAKGTQKNLDNKDFQGTIFQPTSNLNNVGFDFTDSRACQFKDAALGYHFGINSRPHNLKSMLYIGNSTDGTFETTDLTFENLFISGHFSEASLYIPGGCAILTFKNVKAYNVFNSSHSYALAITAVNGRDVRSAFYTVVAGGTYLSMGDIFFKDGCEFHEDSVNVGLGTRALGAAIFLDCVQRIKFDDVSSVSSNIVVLFADGSTVANEVSREVKFDMCVLGRSDLPPLSIVNNFSNDLIRYLSIKNSELQSAGSGRAVIETGGAHTTNGYYGLVLKNNNFGSGASGARALSFANSSNAERLAGPYDIDCMGLPVVLNGSSGAQGKWSNYTSLSEGSTGGAIKGRKVSDSGVASPMIQTGINDELNRQIIALNPVSSSNARIRVTNANSSAPMIDVTGSATDISMYLSALGVGAIQPLSNIIFGLSTGYIQAGTASGTPALPNILLKNNTPAGWAYFSPIAGTGSITPAAAYNIATITDSGTGDFTIFWDRDFATANYALVATCGFGAGGIIYEVSSDRLAGSCRVQVRNTGMSVADPGTISVIAMGLQA